MMKHRKMMKLKKCEESKHKCSSSLCNRNIHQQILEHASDADYDETDQREKQYRGNQMSSSMQVLK